MPKIFALLVSAAALCTVTGTGAHAAACASAAPIATVRMIKDSEGKQYFLPVSVNGSRKLMMLSTVNGTSTFLSEAVEAMNLPIDYLRGPALATAGGDRGYEVATASLAVGDAKVPPSVYLMFPPQADGATLYKADIVGWIGLDVLAQFDFDLDFSASTLTLYENGNCSGAPRAGAQAVSFDFDSKGRIITPVMLDGHELRAALDTSSDVDAVNLNVARDAMGFNVNAPGVTLVPNTGEVATYNASFRSFSLGGISVANPRVLAIQDKLRNQVKDVPETGTNIRNTEDNRMPDFLIGNKLLAQYRVYVAPRERKLYISPAGTR